MSNTKKIKTKKKKEVEQVDALTKMVRDTLSSMGRRVNPYQEKMLVQLLKSFLVGGLATIVDIILYCILCHFMDSLIANLISMIIAFILGFVIGIKYVYDKNSKESNIKQYSILSGIGLFVTEGLLYGFVTLLDWNKILIKILALVIVLIIKILIKRFVFSKKHM